MPGAQALRPAPGFAFAALLTDHLRAVSHDLHLSVNFKPFTAPGDDDHPGDEMKARFPTAIAAMTFLAHVDAIIFDLRANEGGDPKMVALIATYLFDQPTHLNDLYNRRENATTQFTFSGAEEFTSDLKNLKRATIVGETTRVEPDVRVPASAALDAAEKLAVQPHKPT